MKGNTGSCSDPEVFLGLLVGFPGFYMLLLMVYSLPILELPSQQVRFVFTSGRYRYASATFVVLSCAFPGNRLVVNGYG